jgi:electron transfer flavoprotein alpha subunit
MAVLVIADHDNATLKDNTHKVVTAALSISGDVDVLVAGTNTAALGADAAKISGVRKVLTSESAELGQGIAEAVGDLIVGLMGGYDAVLIPATSQGKSFSPRIAAKLDVAQISEVIEVVSADTFVRPIYAGNALETVQSADAKKVLTVRPTAFKAAATDGSAKVEAVAAPGAQAKVHFIDQQIVKSARPDLGAAKIVVSGGRAMGSAEEFQKVIDPLADKLGAAVGASRAAVDAGRHEGFQDHRCDQQGRRCADLPGRRLWSGSRLQDCGAGTDDRTHHCRRLGAVGRRLDRGVASSRSRPPFSCPAPARQARCTTALRFTDLLRRSKPLAAMRHSRARTPALSLGGARPKASRPRQYG